MSDHPITPTTLRRLAQQVAYREAWYRALRRNPPPSKIACAIILPPAVLLLMSQHWLFVGFGGFLILGVLVSWRARHELRKWEG